jgi:NAD(P)-dependent dehydrogenase (short-subunit alcohol dehydrogenase family)
MDIFFVLVHNTGNMENVMDEHPRPQDHELSNKSACVIGGASGIGLAIAAAAQQRGAKVFVTGTSTNSIAAARDTLGDTAQTGVLDIRDRQAVESYCADFKSLDVLINCAGASFPYRELDPAVMADAIGINLLGVGYVCSAMYPALKAARGSVVNFGSLTSFLGSASNPAYSAAKGGIVQLTKSLARMWGADGIRVNAIAPGYVQTKMTAFRWKDEQQAQGIIARTPLGRWAQVEDIVGPTLFLCSDAAGFVTGVTLPVDGGFLLT